MIRNWFKKWKDTKALKKSNWGRDLNWYIEYKGEIIGELVDYKWDDMFWDSYIIQSLDEKWNQTLTAPESWYDFKFKNQYYNQYAENAFVAGRVFKNGTKLNERILMRGLYLTTIEYAR